MSEFISLLSSAVHPMSSAVHRFRRKANPFAAGSTMETYKAIVCRKLRPCNRLYDDADAAALVEGLLVVSTVQRLGLARRGVRGVRDHAFMAAVDWETLLSKQQPAPWLPILDGPLDASCFPPIEVADMQRVEEGEHDMGYGPTGRSVQALDGLFAEI
eukprot:CAMPEP_0174701948 /NCGR_PEP_ID=MMETSP1094-20130205/6405_1 /TAXON_ID=156173 /ORGANISM="Chrysochromulina brevifilum, Strain UTEX LB 985" /LENGTH=157 /DNA_ID=CAMNT_0015899659 /DNA_START=104 /DNA_END=577 /DNA_ORIENTATION=+